MSSAKSVIALAQAIGRVASAASSHVEAIHTAVKVVKHAASAADEILNVTKPKGETK